MDVFKLQKYRAFLTTLLLLLQVTLLHEEILIAQDQCRELTKTFNENSEQLKKLQVQSNLVVLSSENQKDFKFFDFDPLIS